MRKTLSVYYRKLNDQKCIIYRSVSIEKQLEDNEINVTPVINERKEVSLLSLPEEIRSHCLSEGSYAYGFHLPEEWYERLQNKELGLFDLQDFECEFSPRS